MYASPGKHTSNKLQQEVYNSEEDNDYNVTICKQGVHALTGAVTLSTKSHIVSGPMASYLLQNYGSCFHFFSHESEFLGLDCFERVRERYN